jgi:NitT/TauT family transport system substrate-binding protein
MKRRELLQQAAATAAALGLASLGMPAHAQASKTKVKVGYLHVLSVDAHLWIGEHLGTWAKEGLELEPVEFVTGIQLFQALIGGSLDVLTTGGVLSNFPARGQGKVFLLNDIEWKVGQVWAGPDIKTIADLKGKKVATTRGTTAHDLLYHGLKSVNLDVNKDVEIINQRMSDAVTSFIAGAVPAVATWVPFDVQIKARRHDAKLLFDGSKFPDAAIVDGWAARNDFHEKNKDVLLRFIRAWIPANEFIVGKRKETIEYLHTKKYADLSREDVEEMYDAAKFYPTAEWAKYYADGTAAKWLDQVTNFNVAVGAIQNPVMADKYFDPSLFLEAAKGKSKS